MKNFPSRLLMLPPQLAYLFAIPAFFLLLVLAYEPRALCEMMQTGAGKHAIPDMFSFNVAIISAILFVVMLLCRLVFFFLRKTLRMNTVNYILWCVLEMLILSLFVALYLSLIDMPGHGYFYFLLHCAKFFYTTLIFPYILLTLYYYIAMYREDTPVDEGTRLRFYDNRHVLKLITSAGSVLYIKADENYVIIYYQDNGLVRSFQLRNSMRGIEPLCEKAGFVRAHRSFFVNPSHIALIRRDEIGRYIADMDAETEDHIPISKKYYEAVTAAM